MKHLLLAVATLLALGSAAWAQDLSGDWRTAPDDNGHTGIIASASAATPIAAPWCRPSTPRVP
jgi:hypothetical protein